MTPYGFQGRLKAEFPSQIIVDATEVCNLACIHCPHTEFRRSKHYAARHLDVELHHKMVDEIREYGQGCTQYIRYTSNGEPLLHPRIYDMLDYAIKRSNVFVTLTTNGAIMNEKRIEKLLASGLHMVDISIDAFMPETYAEIRRGGNLEVTRGNLLNLLKIKRQTQATTRIVVSFVEQPLNMSETSEFETYWKNQGVDYVIIRRLHSSAGTIHKIADMIRVRENREARRPCLYPWERIILNPCGDLTFCPNDWSHSSRISNFRNSMIRTTWQGETYQQLRKAHLTGNFCNHQFCGQCPDWIQTRWPKVGKSYADMVQEFIKNQ
jgi:MoaA/NifB/PqqE/SkfB family radical SAM enzyme